MGRERREKSKRLMVELLIAFLALLIKAVSLSTNDKIIKAVAIGAMGAIS